MIYSFPVFLAPVIFTVEFHCTYFLVPFFQFNLREPRPLHFRISTRDKIFCGRVSVHPSPRILCEVLKYTEKKFLGEFELPVSKTS